MKPSTATVVVVGAGVAGLVAVRELRKRGHEVIALEARQRIGGRLFPAMLDDSPVDLGGGWIGPKHRRMHALAKELGVETFPTYANGRAVFELGSRRGRCGEIPLLNPLVLAGTGYALAKLDRLVARFRKDAEWRRKHAKELDRQSVGGWIDENVRPAGARSLVRLSLDALHCARDEDVSFLCLIAAAAKSDSFDNLRRVEGGPQERLFCGGTGALLNALAADLGDVVRTGQPVRRIEHDRAGATIVTDDSEIRARQVVVTVPPPVFHRITFAPALEPARLDLVDRMKMGSVVKCVASYERPFWRQEGLSGHFWSDRGPISFGYDTAEPTSKRGKLTAFAVARGAEALAQLPAEERKSAVLATLTRYFGAEASTPMAYRDVVWSDEEWSGGAYAAHAPPGSFAGGDACLRESVGVLSWAGTETATEWAGFMEGAAESGERAAVEVDMRLMCGPDRRAARGFGSAPSRTEFSSSSRRGAKPSTSPDRDRDLPE